MLVKTVQENVFNTEAKHIAFAVNKAARSAENPTLSDWKKIINIFKYLNQTKNYKIIYTGTGEIIAYTKICSTIFVPCNSLLEREHLLKQMYLTILLFAAVMM